MTYITQFTGRSSVYSYRFMTMILAGCAFLLPQSSVVQAQWSAPATNINNTNSGTVSIGTTNPGGDKLIVSGNTIGGNVTSHTQLYSGFDSQNNVVMELSYGTATANVIPYPTIVLSKNLTSANGFLGAFQFANRSIADGQEKRIAQMIGWTDGATNSGALSFNTSSAGALSERMRISSAGNVGIGTTNPTRKLEVLATDGEALRLYRNGNGVSWGVNLKFALNNSSGAEVDYAGLHGVIGSATAGAETGHLVFTNVTNGSLTEKMRITGSGSVGIGTTTPASALDVQAPAAGITTTSTTGTNRAYLATVNTGGSVLMGSESSVGQSLFNVGTLPYAAVFGTSQARPLQLVTNQTARLTIDSAGNVGIGMAPTAKRLQVLGDFNASGEISGGTIVARYQDVAEWVESSQALPAGTVVVLDHTKSNQVIASSQAYDTRVAGVISLQPGITLGENGSGKVLVETTGRVKVKVDATAGPILVGDLLVTGDKEGVAKKSEPLSLGGVQIHRPGTLIGKALEPLEKGSGEILVLLSLQ
jgi:hypothetical protein